MAENLAVEAEDIAATLERLAEIHERLAADDHNVVKAAKDRAEAERAITKKERLASGWFRSIASGRYRAHPPEDQRLPSQ